jgi:hypothetical protein
VEAAPIDYIKTRVVIVRRDLTLPVRPPSTFTGQRR